MTPKQIEKAHAIRDSALRLIRTVGTAGVVGSEQIPVLTLQVAGVEILLSAPPDSASGEFVQIYEGSEEVFAFWTKGETDHLSTFRAGPWVDRFLSSPPGEPSLN